MAASPVGLSNRKGSSPRYPTLLPARQAGQGSSGFVRDECYSQNLRSCRASRRGDEGGEGDEAVVYRTVIFRTTLSVVAEIFLI